MRVLHIRQSGQFFYKLMSPSNEYFSSRVLYKQLKKVLLHFRQFGIQIKYASHRLFKC